MADTWNIHLPSHDRVYRLTGRDSLVLLQRISTNDLSPVAKGGGATTLLTNEKGRVKHVIGVHAGPDGSLWVAAVSDPDGSTASWIERFVIMEDVIVVDLTSGFRTVVSFVWDTVHERWQEPPTTGRTPTIPVRTWTNRWSMLIVPRSDGDPVLAELQDAGAILIANEDFHDKRVRAGIPWEGTELTDERHPLEARLRSLISFTKGCYVGQEVVARLDTYRKVQHVMSRLSGTLPDELPLPSPLMAGDGQEVGTITSICNGGEAGARALGFIRVSHMVLAGEFTTPRGGTLRMLDGQSEDGVYR